MVWRCVQIKIVSAAPCTHTSATQMAVEGWPFDDYLRGLTYHSERYSSTVQ